MKIGRLPIHKKIKTCLVPLYCCLYSQQWLCPDHPKDEIELPITVCLFAVSIQSTHGRKAAVTITLRSSNQNVKNTGRLKYHILFLYNEQISVVMTAWRLVLSKLWTVSQKLNFISFKNSAKK